MIDILHSNHYSLGLNVHVFLSNLHLVFVQMHKLVWVSRAGHAYQNPIKWDHLVSKYHYLHTTNKNNNKGVEKLIKITFSNKLKSLIPVITAQHKCMFNVMNKSTRWTKAYLEPCQTFVKLFWAVNCRCLTGF